MGSVFVFFFHIKDKDDNHDDDGNSDSIRMQKEVVLTCCGRFAAEANLERSRS